MKYIIILFVFISIIISPIESFSVSFQEKTKPLNIQQVINTAKQNSYLIKIAESNNQIISLNIIR